ncbi:RNA polymerase sigma factor [Agrococcus sp. SGAir0287]|uniref:RNA polymerase sigma factor n=1 Tax=Agrococcus sp. SGAir0287 TaxID=2070347 RepID=UPI0020C7A3BC|nr:RNA polymerase sigma factor [Agrococcus sp. SGAir0287]
MTAEQTDAQLWAAVVRGDGIAFATVFDRHGDRVWRHAWRIMQHRQDTEDVVSAAFAEAWRKRSSVRIVDDSLLPWLLITATNCARNASRGRRRLERLIAHIPRADDAPDAADVAGDRDEAETARTAVADALRALSPADASLIALVMLEDMPLADAARALGIGYGAAKTRIHRARGRMRAHLEAAGMAPSMEEVP